MLDLSHKKLDVYKIALSMLKEIYRITKALPREEQFELSKQLRRAAVSVCSNIAEGAAMFSKKEKKKFYTIARGSIVEIDTQLEIALQQEFIVKEQIEDLSRYMVSVFRILSKIISNLRL